MTLCDCHSAPCFKVFQYIHVGLYSVLEFYHLLYFKIQKLVEKYMYYFICYYLAQLLVTTYRITAMVSRCDVLGCAPSYLRVLCCPVSVFAARRVLHSAARGEFLVPRARLAIMQRRAFSIVGPSAWNDLPFELRSVLMAHPSKFYIS